MVLSVYQRNYNVYVYFYTYNIYMYDSISIPWLRLRRIRVNGNTVTAAPVATTDELCVNEYDASGGPESQQSVRGHQTRYAFDPSASSHRVIGYDNIPS